MNEAVAGVENIIESITLTEYGETLTQDERSRPKLATDELPRSIGRHDVCGGWIDITDTSPSHRVIICRNCYLRLPIPQEVKTYGQLQQFFRFQTKPKPPI